MNISAFIFGVGTMRYILTLYVTLCGASFCLGQARNVTGVYSNGLVMPYLRITLNADSTFTYKSTVHPTFSRWEEFSGAGRWALSEDTVILNPHLPEKTIVEVSFEERLVACDDAALHLTFNHIKRYYDESGNIRFADTVQVSRLDYAFNTNKRKRRVRVAERPTTRCAFAGHIPPEIITTSRTIVAERPNEVLERLYVSCYELQGTREFRIENTTDNHFIVNVYSNYYDEGQIRHMKLLMGRRNVLYTARRSSGKFDKGWTFGTILKKERHRV